MSANLSVADKSAHNVWHDKSYEAEKPREADCRPGKSRGEYQQNKSPK